MKEIATYQTNQESDAGASFWESGELELVNPEADNQHLDLRTSRRRLTALKGLTMQLVREVQSIGEVKVLDIDGGLDFYNEVTSFEIDLITRALVLTGGHQARAAKLLNLKGTTLNSKIKSYKIKPESFTGSSALASLSNASEAQGQDSVKSSPKPSFA